MFLHRKCQRACEKLDLEDSIEKPALHWFWPNRKTAEQDAEEEQSDEESDTEVEYELGEKLDMLTNYLRTTYCFCYWCGTKFSDKEDLNINCPGMKKDDH